MILGTGRRSLGVARVARIVLVAAGLAACNRDQPTSPLTSRPLPGGAASRTKVTTLGTYSIPIPGTSADNGGAQPVTNTGIIVPAGTYYRVRVNGTTTVSTNPVFATIVPYATYEWDGTYGPGGAGGYSYLLVQLKARNTNGSGTNPINLPNLGYGTSAPDSARSDILFANTEAEIQAGRNGLACSGNNSQGSGNIGCYLLSASQTVTVEAVSDIIHEVANPVAVHPNQQVTFTASRDDGGPLNINTWYWQPDTGQPGSPGTACGAFQNPTCQKQVGGSGTMTVYATVGYATAHVTVYTHFTLVADPTTVHWGDTVTFTPNYDGVSGAVARWRWVQDSTPDSPSCALANPACKTPIHASGTVGVHRNVRR